MIAHYSLLGMMKDAGKVTLLGVMRLLGIAAMLTYCVLFWGAVIFGLRLLVKAILF